MSELIVCVQVIDIVDNRLITRYWMNYNDLQERKVLGEQCSSHFPVGAVDATTPVIVAGFYP